MPDADIVVVGRREKQSDGSYLISYRTETGIPGIKFLTPRNVDEDSPLEEDIEIAVKIERTKADTDQAKMELAAQKLIKAAMDVLAKLVVADPSTLIIVLGRTVTVGDMLDTLLNTQFTITDQLGFGNNGVGTAQHGTNGPNTDTINYQSILGSSNSNGYADPAFPDNSGMHALVLHEVAHMTQVGYDFWSRSTEVWRDEHNPPGANFYDSDYAPNLEAFANDIMTGVSARINVDLHGVRPGTAAFPVTPESIFEAHTGTPYPS